MNVYTKFARADGHTVWLHMDQWEGQNWKRSPGNIYGDPVRITFDPASPTPIRLRADKVIPPIIVPPDSGNVRRFIGDNLSVPSRNHRRDGDPGGWR